MRVGRRTLMRAAVAATATGALPRLSWADAGAPTYLSAAKLMSGAYALIGLSDTARVRFALPLPGRGHAAAAHPTQPLAVAFARRPGTFALVIDCVSGGVRATLTAPPGRHFYGHGAFDAEGALLLTAENDFERGVGRVGVWSVEEDFRRIDEFSSGGVGPHEVVVDRGSGRLIAANGGIQTHPESGRAKLNLPTMRPNIAYLDASTGEILDVIEPSAALRKNSLRHLAARGDGLIAVAREDLSNMVTGRILVIEDELAVANEISEIVMEMGHSVIGNAPTKEDALEIVEQVEPDLILSDIQLANGGSGITAVCEILRTYPMPPVIYITG